MCGITGCVVQNGHAMPAVMRGLNKLQNRGYDSVGVCAFENYEFVIVKYVTTDCDNAMEKLNKNTNMKNNKSKIAIGHTRWATHGPKTIENAHPHYDNDKHFSLVHNGIIENYADMKNELIDNGFTFYGQTDTEIIAKYLAFLSAKGENYTHLNKIMKGAWAILFMEKTQPNKIFYLKNGSPLIIGYNRDRTKVMLVSELSGFDPDIEYYNTLCDGDYGYVHLTDTTVNITSQYIYTPLKVPIMDIPTSPAPYAHWTIKEINDQPKAITSLLTERLKKCDKDILNFPELEKNAVLLKSIEHFIFLGCGTSYHAAQIGVKFFKEFGTNATFDIIDGSEFQKSDIPCNRKCLMVLLSQSGETKDLYRTLVIGKEKNIPSIGIVNVENSLISKEVDICLYLKAGREMAVASTKSFTNQVIMLLLIALWINPTMDYDLKEKYISGLKTLANDFTKIINESEAIIPEIVSLLEKKTDCFILGKHVCEWIAREAALKIKEITYIHAEGVSLSSLKHGPFALLDKDMPVIIIANNDEFYSKVENITAEVKSRAAKIIYITNKTKNVANTDIVYYYDTNSILFPLLAIIPLQILSYRVALAKNLSCDSPRNLAKVVTVE